MTVYGKEVVYISLLLRKKTIDSSGFQLNF